MPPTWTQAGGQFEAFQWGTPSIQVVLQGSQDTFSKIWVSFLLGSWVGHRCFWKAAINVFNGNYPKLDSICRLQINPSTSPMRKKTIYTLHSSSDMMLHRKYIEWPSWKWHLSLATPTKMRETNNQSMSHGKIESAQVFTCEGSQMIAPTNPNRTSNVKTKYTTSCSLQWLFHDILNRNFPKTVLQPRELDVVKTLAVKTLFWNKCVQALVDMGLHGHHAAVAIQNQNQTLEVLGHHFYRVSFRTLPPLF